MRAPIPVETDRKTYDSSSKEWHPDLAMRYSHSLGSWDIGLSHFTGTSREAVFKTLINIDGDIILAPHYDLIDQTGADIQYTIDGWLYKLEAMTRTGHGRRFIAITGVFEYTFYSVVNNDTDLGILAEYQYDDR